MNLSMLSLDPVRMLELVSYPPQEVDVLHQKTLPPYDIPKAPIYPPKVLSASG